MQVKKESQQSQSRWWIQNYQLDQVHRKDGEKDARTERGKQDCGEIQADGDGPGQFCSFKFFICEQSGCVEKSGDTQSFKSTGCIIRETWCKHKSKFQSRRSVEFSRMAKGCSTVHKHRGTCSNWVSRISTKSLAASFSCITRHCTSYGESLLNHTTELRSEADGWLEGSRCEYSSFGLFYVCHTSSCSSPWARLFTKSSIYQESTIEVCETVVSNDWEVDHGSDRNYWTDQDWLEPACVERDDSVNWQSCSDCEFQNHIPGVRQTIFMISRCSPDNGHCTLTWKWSFLWIAQVHTLIPPSSFEFRRKFPM